MPPHDDPGAELLLPRRAAHLQPVLPQDKQSDLATHAGKSHIHFRLRGFLQIKARSLHRADTTREDSSDEECSSFDAIFDLEDIELDADVKPGGRYSSTTYSGAAAKRTGIQTGDDPLSALAKSTEEQGRRRRRSLAEEEEEEEEEKADRKLAREIEMYMEHVSSPHRSPLRGPLSGPAPQTPSRSSSLVSPLSSSSSSSFPLDSLLTPKLDSFRSSVVSASREVVDRASRWYLRMSTPGSTQDGDLPGLVLDSSDSVLGKSSEQKNGLILGSPGVGPGLSPGPNPPLRRSPVCSPTRKSAPHSGKRVSLPGLPDRSEASSRYTSNSSIFSHFAIEVLISSCSLCTSCNSLVYDEEIMSGWSADDSNLNSTCPFCSCTFLPLLNVEIRDFRSSGRLHPKTSAEDRSSSSYSACSALNSGCSSVSTPCPSVSSTSSPDLSSTPVPPSALSRAGASQCAALPSVKHRRALSPGQSLARSVSDNCEIRELPHILPQGLPVSESLPSHLSQPPECVEWCMRRPEPVTVPYLSPLVLWKELESLLENEGPSCLCEAALVDLHPIIFWNLLWFFTRLQLPSHLPGLVLRSDHCNRDAPVFFPREPMCDDSKHVLVHTLWDNLKLHQDPLQPLYLLWNSYNVGYPSLGPVPEQQKSFSEDVLRGIIHNIQRNDLNRPLSQLLQLLGLTLGVHRQRSVYRDLLFLALVALGRENIDVDAFDREYRLAYDRLSPASLKLTQSCDTPPPAGVKTRIMAPSSTAELQLFLSSSMLMTVRRSNEQSLFPVADVQRTRSPLSSGWMLVLRVSVRARARVLVPAVVAEGREERETHDQPDRQGCFSSPCPPSPPAVREDVMALASGSRQTQVQG
uniref:Uncharacterized protein n=1 Tax=Knipowitschia caucasica TaxID=637954 RepID=A0AAV2LUU6_KNICA